MRKISLAWKQAKVTQDALIFLGICSLVFVIFFVKLWDPKFLRLRVPNLLRKFLFGPKFVKMAQFICLPVTTGFFSGLLWWSQIFFGNFLLAQKWAKIEQNGSFCLLLQHFLKVRFFMFCMVFCTDQAKDLGKFSFVWKCPQIAQFVCLYI